MFVISFYDSYDAKRCFNIFELGENETIQDVESCFFGTSVSVNSKMFNTREEAQAEIDEFNKTRDL
jgi:hypothetical protein